MNPALVRTILRLVPIAQGRFKKCGEGRGDSLVSGFLFSRARNAFGVRGRGRPRSFLELALPVTLLSLSTHAGAPPPAQCTVEWNDVHQRIDGFGASSAWQSAWTPALADMLFSTNSGVGTSKNGAVHFNYSGIALSLLRNHIKTNGTSTDETSLMQMAQTRGARLWSTPWSPPPQYKSNTNVNGGSFLTAGNNYDTYAALLAKYVVNMNNIGLNIYALSVQNEPDANVTTYESCNWTSTQIHDFLPSLSSAFAASNVAATKIIIAESQNWKFDLASNSMNDLATANLVGILAAHSYGSPEATVVNNYGKPLWETEDSLLSGSDSSITNGVFWAQEIHNYMTVAQANAWHYWWLLPGGGTGNEGLADTNWIPAKRMYTVGNFSRFVRPGYFRIGVTNNSAAQISAYKYPNSGNFAIVAIDPGSIAITQAFNLSSFPAPPSVGAWITSSNLNLTNQPAVAISNSSFTYVLPPLSVLTFVWQTNLAPADITLVKSSVPENQPAGTTVGPFVTTDPDPANTFTYALVSGTGSDDNISFTISSNKLFTAASFNYELKNTYSIRVRSTDQRGLSFEKVFTISVTDVNLPPATPANLLPANAAAGQPPTLTLQGSAFSDPNVNDSHAASEWLVRRSADSALVFDSGTDSVNRTSIALPAGVLDYGTTYNWQVRYQDNHGAWSDYSAATAFSTVAPGLTPSVQNGNLVLSWPANTTNLDLEYATNLSAPAWAPVSPPPVRAGEQFVLTNSMTDAAGFFRLRKP